MKDRTIKNQSSESGTKKIIEDNEIDLIQLVKVLWDKKLSISKIAGVFMIFGIVLALTSPKEYETSSILIPEAINEEGKLGGSLGGLASLAGVDLGGLSGGSQAINPALYQSVSRSTPFLLELMKQEYYFQELGETTSIENYYLEHFKVGLFGKLMSIPRTMIGWLKGAQDSVLNVGLNDISAISLTKAEQLIIDDLMTRVLVEMDWELNIVTIQVEMQDPVVAARMVQFTQDYITNYVSNYAVLKGQQQLKSLETQYQERKDEFQKAQLNLASFRDRNLNMSSARVRSEEERLQSEYNLAFNIYDQLAQQREAVRLQIQESTPVFTVLEPVKIPVEKSKPRRMLITLIFAIVGVVVGILTIVLRFK